MTHILDRRYLFWSGFEVIGADSCCYNTPIRISRHLPADVLPKACTTGHREPEERRLRSPFTDWRSIALLLTTCARLHLPNCEVLEHALAALSRDQLFVPFIRF